MRGRTVKDWIGLAALFGLGLWVLLLASAGTAFGYFTTKGRGTQNITLASLVVPTPTAKAAAGGTVTLTWPESEAPGAVAYYVTRGGEAPGGNCPTAAEPENEVGGCTDTGLEPGTYVYKVVAKYKSWSASGEASAKITVGPAHHFVLSAASNAPSAGASDSLTITAKDKAGSTVTTYTGSHSLTFEGAAAIGSNTPTVSNSSGTAVAFGNATAITFTNGVATVSSTKNGVMKLYKAGVTTLSVTDGTIETETDPVVTVAPLTMSKLVLSAATATPAVGAEDALTTTAEDTYGNVATGYTGSKSLKYSGPVASPNGTAPYVTDSSGNAVAIGTATPTTFVAGVATVSEGHNGALVLFKAATASVKVTEGSISSATVTITASPGTAAALKLAATTTTPVAAATDNLTTIALDAYGNTATSYTGSHNITFSGAEPSPSGTAASVYNSAGTAVNVGTATALTFTAGVATGGSSKNGVLKAARSGTNSLAATDGTISTASALVLTVSAGTAAKYAWSSPTNSAGVRSELCLFTCTITGFGNGSTTTFTAKIAVTDSLGNVVSNLGIANTVAVSSTGGTITGGSLTIATTGLAESSASFTYMPPTSGTYSNTITATKASGTAYSNATVTVSK